MLNQDWWSRHCPQWWIILSPEVMPFLAIRTWTDVAAPLFCRRRLDNLQSPVAGRDPFFPADQSGINSEDKSG
jgi:hypothetical protein